MQANFLNLVSSYRLRFPGDNSRADPFESFLKSDLAWLERTTEFGHLTASGWVLSPDGLSTVLIHHRKLNRWLQPGGHSDGDPLTLRVALKEVEEETGIVEPEVFDISAGRFSQGILGAELLPFDLDAHEIPAFGGFPAHIHFDFRYLFRARSTELSAGDAGVSQVRWFNDQELNSQITEPGMLRMLEKSRALTQLR